MKNHDLDSATRYGTPRPENPLRLNCKEGDRSELLQSKSGCVALINPLDYEPNHHHQFTAPMLVVLRLLPKSLARTSMLSTAQKWLEDVNPHIGTLAHCRKNMSSDR